MARTFNGNIWTGIGDTISMQDALRRQQHRESLGGLLDAAKFIEKTNANRKLQKDWQDYFRNRGQSGVDTSAAADAAAAQGVEDSSAVEPNAIDLYGLNLFGIKNDEPVQSIFLDPSEIANGYSVAGGDSDADFMENFDPENASPEDIIRAQEIIGTTADGKWGPKSRLALKNWRD